MYDTPVLADGLLLASGAHWEDWFTRGYSHFFDTYPEWPFGLTGFTRPAFQFVIYLAHFALGRDWASYQVISCFAVAGVAVVAFLIARTALELRPEASLLAAALVVVSPPLLQCWQIGLGTTYLPLATLLVAGAFLAVVTRHDFLCVVLLFVALLTTEHAVWAPLAAAITIVLRHKSDETLRYRAFAAAAMLLPVALWLSLRFAFFGGIGGTYATAGYTPLANFLALTFHKLTHIDALFIDQRPFVTEGRGALLDRAITIGARLLIYALFSLLALRIIPKTINLLRYAICERRWPAVDATFLVPLWAAIALAFHFALALSYTKYASSAVVFAWPALVAEIERRRKAIIWLCLAAFCVVATLHSYHFVDFRWLQREISPMNAAVHQVPMTTRQVYVLPDIAGSLPNANPEYVRLVLGVAAEIVRVIDIDWNCGLNDVVAFDHIITDGVVNMAVTLPDCASFLFLYGRIDANALANGHLYRNATMSYELPEAYPITHNREAAAYVERKMELHVGRRITVHVRPNGPARFIIQHGGPNGGIAWFDTP
jgi:hypothetical protein